MRHKQLFDLWRLVNGMLKSTIDAHGPITRKNLGSAGKRIASQIYKTIGKNSDYIPWKVVNCLSESCPMLCLRFDEIELMTGEKPSVSQTTVCPKCLRSIKWSLRDLFDKDGTDMHAYCRGIANPFPKSKSPADLNK